MKKYFVSAEKSEKLLSYGDTAEFEVIEEKINGGIIAFEINTEELFAINDSKENRRVL